jgi:hypothetical protein
MNVLIFLGGLGSGAVITTMLFLFLINRLVGSRTKDSDRIQEYNEASVAELKRRNDIGERQVSALKTIATWCENNWTLPQ